MGLVVYMKLLTIWSRKPNERKERSRHLILFNDLTLNEDQNVSRRISNRKLNCAVICF